MCERIWLLFKTIYSNLRQDIVCGWDALQDWSLKPCMMDRRPWMFKGCMGASRPMQWKDEAVVDHRRLLKKTLLLNRETSGQWTHGFSFGYKLFAAHFVSTSSCLTLMMMMMMIDSSIVPWNTWWSKLVPVHFATKLPARKQLSLANEIGRQVH